MKIDYLEIRSPYKNLNNVKVDFDEDNLMTVVVGRNGSGKSNVLEAIVEIFRNLDLGETAPFSYAIKYKLGNIVNEKWISIKADIQHKTAAKQYKITCEIESKSQIIPISKVKRDKEGHSKYLPKYIFAYYSGPSDRLEKHFKTHRTKFYKALLDEEIDLAGDLRPLFYAKPYHSQFVLLAFFLSKSNEKERSFLKEHIGIESLDSIHFVLRQPNWAKDKKELFWGARGVVREFLDKLYPYTMAPVKIKRQEDTSLTGSNIQNEFFHLFLPNVDVLRDFAKNLSPEVFFKMLESTLLSEIISEVSIRVKTTSSDKSLTFSELSEGEQQLLTVLGLLKFTGGKDSLFLLDEPDTHLNPSWAVKYLEFLKDFVPDHENSHLLMVTHQPLAIAELEKEQLQVMWSDDENQVHAQMPEESPKGLGFSGILTSDLFGLQTTLDSATEQLIRLRREYSEKENLSQIEKTELCSIDKQLKELGFTTSHWDSEYSEYLTIKNEMKLEQENKKSFTPKQIQLRKKIARDIIEKQFDRISTGE